MKTKAIPAFWAISKVQQPPAQVRTRLSTHPSKVRIIFSFEQGSDLGFKVQGLGLGLRFRVQVQGLSLGLDLGFRFRYRVQVQIQGLGLGLRFRVQV